MACISLLGVVSAACSGDDAPDEAGPVGTDAGAADEGDGGSAGVEIDPAYPEPEDWPEPPDGVANRVGPDHEMFAGQQRFLWDTWDTEVLDEWPPAEFMLGLMEEEPEVFGNQFEAFGFIPDPTDDFPFGFKRGSEDPSKVHQTCSICHVSRLPSGELWIGGPNLELDYGAFRAAVNERWVDAGNEPLLTELEAEKTVKLGPGRFHAETSTYPEVVPADFPAYFGLAGRARFNHLGTGRTVRTETFFSVFTFGAGNPNPDEAVVPFPVAERVEPMAEYIGWIDAPVAPEQPAELITRGKEVFEEASCAQCHHVDAPRLDRVVTHDGAEDGRERLPDEDSEFPNGSIRTSAAHRLLLDGESMDRGYEDLIRFIIDNGLNVGMSDGYRTPTLEGVWLTAPYLHNGSVPTLEALLSPAAERPVTFMRGDFEVDTTAFGNGNEGHEFGTDLSDEDEAALIAYLKSL